jgi:glycosyltransferase involved in cell wall biosynthesis
MNKPLVLVTAPIATRSGYGNHSRDIVSALIDLDKYEVKVNPVRWGNTPMNALEDGNPIHDKIKECMLNEPSLPTQPDLHIHIVVPNEFNPLGKKNIGITAGVETTVPPPQWVEGMNRMDLNILTSKFSKHGFESCEFEQQDKHGNKGPLLKVEKPMDTLFEGVDTDVYKPTKEISEVVKETFDVIDSDFNFLSTGHWLSGNLGEDRKDIGMLIKVFCESFKNQKNPPGLILKTSGATFSVMDREEILSKIKSIKGDIKGILPSVYLIHGDLTDEEMNQMYNHPKVKAHISFTHGEGFGRPLLEAAQSGKPVIAPGWSGQVDFLNPNYSVLLSGSLVKVPKNSFPKEILFDGAQWFQTNYQHASQIMQDVVKNYTKHLVKSKQLQVYTKSLFSYEKMREKLDKIITPLIESVPQQVELKLPKLQKVEEKTEKGKLKLPKLKKGK